MQSVITYKLFAEETSQKQVLSQPPSLSTTTNNTTVTWFAQTTNGFFFKLFNTHLNFRLHRLSL